MSDAAALTQRDGLRAGGTQVHAGRPIKYQLNVLGATVADVVASAGGWVFDRAMAGWEVNVLVTTPDVVRPVEILGARCFDLDTGLQLMKKGGYPHALAVATDVFDGDERVRQAVLAALRRGSTEISFWGAGSPASVDRTVRSVKHPLTAAAKAFKAQALTAIAATQAPGATETFFSSGSSFR
jgi:hypothetical protein